MTSQVSGYGAMDFRALVVVLLRAIEKSTEPEREMWR
jgi:hypothetical protein